MVILGESHLVGERQRYADFALILGSVGAVSDLALVLPILNGCEGFIADNLPDVVLNTVDVVEVCDVEASAVLVAEYELHARVDNRLTLHNIKEIIRAHVDIGKHLDIGLPVDFCTRILAAVFFLFETADVLAVLKMQTVFEAVALYLYVHKLGSKLS